MADESFDKVGLGVDLLGGSSVLTDLRAIRAEMTAIAQLGRGGRGGGIFSQEDTSIAEQRVRAREKVEKDSTRRIAEDRARIARTSSKDEIDIQAQAVNKKLELNRQVNQRAEQLRREEQARVFQAEAAKQAQITRLQVEADEKRQREILRRRNSFARQNSPVLSRTIGQLEDIPLVPARGVRVIPGQRPRAAEREAQQLREIQAERAERTRIAAERRRENKQLEDIRTRELLYEGEQVRILNKAERDAAKIRATSGLASGQQDFQVRDYRQISQRRRQAQDEIVNISQVRSRALADNRPAYVLQHIEREQLKAIANYKALAIAERQYLQGQKGSVYQGFGGGRGFGGPAGPSGRGPRGPSRRPQFGDEDQVANPRGFFTSLDAVGRITRNILLYEAISQVSYGLTDYISKAITAAKTTVEFSNALRFATEAAGGNVAENEQLAESLQVIGLSRQQGRAAVTEAIRFAERRPQDTERLTRIVANIAAERGGGIERTDELIEQIRRRESKFYKRIFGRTVESIYEEEAGREIDKRTTSVATTPELFIGIGPTEFKSRNKQIQEYVSAMDDAGKENAVFNYILSQESKFAGEAATRATTLAGRIDKLNAAFLNGQESLGLFITDLKLFRDITDYLSKGAGVLDRLRPATLGRTGAQGTISRFDVERYGLESTTGPRARTLATVDALAGPAALGALGLGAAALLGRRPAIAAAQQRTYDQVLATVTTKFNGDLNAATQSAIYQAKNARAGMAAKIGAGLNRVTNNLTARVNDVLYYAGDLVGADRFAGASARRAGVIRGTIGRTGTSLSPEYLAAQARGSSVGGVGAGIAGGVGGAIIGSLIADKITSNQIVATGITILGGVAGTAAGTALGQAAGAAIGAKIGVGGIGSLLSGGAGTAAAGGAGAAATGGVAALGLLAGYLTGSLIEPIISQVFNLPAAKQRRDDIRLGQEEAKSGAYAQQTRERQGLVEQDRIRYRSTRPGDTLGLLTESQVVERGIRGDRRGGFLGYLEEVIPSLNEAQKKVREYEKARIDLKKSLDDNDILPDAIKLRRLAQFETESADAISRAKTENKQYYEYLDDYRARQAKSISDRLEKDRADEEKKRQAYISQVTNSLSKLRDAEQGAFRVTGDVAQSIAGGDNEYVKVLSDQATAAERMRQQWGFLGKAATDYFITIEQGAVNRQLNKLEFQTYATATNIRTQADREARQRGGPGFSRGEQDYLDIQSAIVDKALQIPKLWADAAQILGQQVNPLQQLQGRLTSLQIATGTGAETTGPFQRIAGFSAGARTSTFVLPDGSQITTMLDSGRRNDYAAYEAQSREFTSLSPELRREVQTKYADAALSIFGEFTPEQIRGAGLGGAYIGAIRTRASGLDQRIFEAQQKAQFGAVEDAKLREQLRADEDFRRRQIAGGYSARDVGREADTLLLARTEGIAPKDLTFDQFRSRQEALRRQADRAEQDRQEAKAAVDAGLAMQAQLLETVQTIRAAILGGDLSMLIQVQNDTQARIDQESLEDLGSGKYNIPLDQGQTKSSPYSDSFTRYKRGGRR